MLAIKLRPVGKKKQISFRIIVAKKRSKLKGKFIEDLGWYNPHTNKFLIKKEEVNKWLKNGAQPTDSVYNILVKAGLIEGKKRPVHAKTKKEKETIEGNENNTQEKIKTVEPRSEANSDENIGQEEQQKETREDIKETTLESGDKAEEKKLKEQSEEVRKEESKDNTEEESNDKTFKQENKEKEKSDQNSLEEANSEPEYNEKGEELKDDE